jgi:hypothetical protein
MVPAEALERRGRVLAERDRPVAVPPAERGQTAAPSQSTSTGTSSGAIVCPTGDSW